MTTPENSHSTADDMTASVENADGSVENADSSGENADAAAEDRRTRGSTTILLAERDADDWLATQGGVPVEGRGETAAEAAAEYCRKVDDMDE